VLAGCQSALCAKEPCSPKQGAGWRDGRLFLSSWWAGDFGVCSLVVAGRFLTFTAFAASLDVFYQCSGTNRGAPPSDSWMNYPTGVEILAVCS